VSVVADRKHRLAQERLADATSRKLSALIFALDDPEADDAIERYAPVAARVVSGGQHRSARFALAYLATTATRAPGKSPPSVTRALDGVLVDESFPVARSPILRLKKRLADGDELALARQSASSYAEELATGDLQAAERGGLDEAARASGKKIRGWRKVLSSEPCDWCRTIASDTTGRYRSAETVPFHARDHCSVAPVFEEGPASSTSSDRGR
jgi:hypothetical protein